MHIRGKIKPLSWESDFFALNCGAVEFDEDCGWINVTDLKQFELVQARVSSNRFDLIDALIATGFCLVESEMDFSYSVTKKISNAKYRVASFQDIPALRQIAAAAFKVSRFRPPWYAKDDSCRLYTQWVESAVCGTFDDQCLLIEQGREIQGFITLRKQDYDHARIGLLAVCHNQRNRGIGRQLVRAGHRWCTLHGSKILQVATQCSNLPAIRFYIQSGALVSSISYWLYKKMA